MDQKQIEDIVRSVMASMGQPQSQPQAPAASTPACHAACASERWWKAARWTWVSGSEAWIGVQHPHRAEVLTELKRSTAARVCTGRAGPRPRTQALLRFLADHSRSKDTVLKEVPEAWVKAQGLPGSAFRD
ncbi:ethanolamine ammonia-lyase small subunit [Klebsiella pneumoniae]|uniref:Ethanolamine ammonia-lyase small subunit n=1 Tax=Klebsiella pneumoniae TaxID=573 RepID=A0A377WR50_KLEPN|nr:ethanolamine ammonia-lyase small subunit [Klebsiella pneumoniae]